MGKKGPNGEGFYRYRETLQSPEIYYRNGKPTVNSGKKISCPVCGETKSAVGSKNGRCKSCHQEIWRIRKGMVPINEELHGNSFRSPRTGLPVAHKYCQSCRVVKHRDQFVLHTAFECPRVIAAPTCKECRIGKNTLPLVRRDSEFLKEFLGNRCGICENPILGKNAHLDHCHNTGIIRGLLCNCCNSALGLLRDRLDILDKMRAYLTSTDLKRTQ
jgi:hypothetical protein